MHSLLNDWYYAKKPYLRDIEAEKWMGDVWIFERLYLNEKEYNEKIDVIEEKKLNSIWYTTDKNVLQYYPSWNSDPMIYKDGDFILHLCGMSIEDRYINMEKFYKKIQEECK
jgi:hypothetical protein